MRSWSSLETALEAGRARFHAKVDNGGPVPAHRPELGACHVWKGELNRLGYGRVSVRVATVRQRPLAHRVAWFLAFGRWPEPCCLHECDNPRCVRVDHLREGTKEENSRDMVDKGRAHNRVFRGEENGSAKLTAAEVRAIRLAVANGATQVALAARHGVDPSTIGLVVRRKKWRHLS